MAESNTPENETLITFPCDFPIKIMGDTHEDFSAEITKAIQVHAPDFNTSSIEMRGSTGGKYISLTCHIHVESKPQLDEIYRVLSAHPMVKFVL